MRKLSILLAAVVGCATAPAVSQRHQQPEQNQPKLYWSRSVTLDQDQFFICAYSFSMNAMMCIRPGELNSDNDIDRKWNMLEEAPMEKLGVVIDTTLVKTGSETRVCPKCGLTVSRPKCDNCGTEPWEKRPDTEPKK